MFFYGIVYNGECYEERKISATSPENAFQSLKFWSENEFPWCEYVEDLILLDESGVIVTHDSKYQWASEKLKEFVENLNHQRNINKTTALAIKLNDFYKDFDFYDYMDSVDGAQTEEILVEGIVEQLANLKAVNGIIEFLNDIKENGEPDNVQAKVLDELIEEVRAIQNSFGRSVDEVLADASIRSEKQAPDTSHQDKGKEAFDLESRDL